VIFVPTMHTIPELASPQSWQSTLPSRRAEIAQAILEGLPRGFEFAKPFVSTEPAEGAAWEVPCFYDAQHETTLTLVLGGDFTYGARAQRLDKLRDSIPAEDWSLIAPVVHAAKEADPVHVPAFLMGRFPTFEWVIEEHVDLCDGLERPDFSSEDGPFPAYVTQEEAQRFLAATGYRLPWDHEWEYVAKAGTERLYVCGDAVPQRDPSGDVCLTQFGDGQGHMGQIRAQPLLWRAWHSNVLVASFFGFRMAGHAQSPLPLGGGSPGPGSLSRHQPGPCSPAHDHGRCPHRRCQVLPAGKLGQVQKGQHGVLGAAGLQFHGQSGADAGRGTHARGRQQPDHGCGDPGQDPVQGTAAQWLGLGPGRGQCPASE